MTVLSGTMSDHFKRSLKAIAFICVWLVAGYLWLRSRIHDIMVPPQIVLPKNDKELITYDENRHIVTVTTAKGTTRAYSRDPSVEIRRDGTVKVNDHAWGTEARPFLGAGYSDTGRVYAGCQLLYFHQLDLGASFGWTSDANKPLFQPMLAIGYNFWSSTSINVGANPLSLVGLSKPEVAVFLSVRL